MIGLVGSGKTELYRKLNENRQMYAVEIELPQSCINDEKLKVDLFNLFYFNPNIECIIAHPYYLPKNFWKIVKSTDEIIYLNLSLKERLRRIRKRSKSLKVQLNIFPKDFIKKEESNFIIFKEARNEYF